MKKFELFVGCLGNGLTVCNKAVIENGDFKHVAHISDIGKITWYVNPETYIPDTERKKIEKYAAENKKMFFEFFDKKSIAEKWIFLADQMNTTCYMYMLKIPSKEKQIEYMLGVLTEKSTWA